MAFGAEEILGWNALTASVQLQKDGLPDYLPKPFFTTKEEVPFDKAQYIESKGMRKLARRVPYGSPGRQIGKLDLNERDIRLMNFREVMPLNNELIQGFRQWDQYVLQQKNAINQIEYHGRGARTRFDNIRKAVLMGSLALGINYFDSEGYLLPTSAGADSSKTVDQLVPSYNKGTCLDPAGNVIVTASWATASTDIVSQILNLKSAILQRTGLELKYAFYGKNVAGYIKGNSSAIAYYPFAQGGVNAIAVMDGKVPPGFMGLEWIPVQSSFFEKEDGTIVEQFPADQVTFFPEVTRDTYTLFEGTTMVPTFLGITGNDLNSAFNSFKPVVGMGGYAKADEFKIDINYFDVFLPRFKITDAVVLLDTTP